MNKRFATFLLTGKAATLPALLNQAMADVTPSYMDVLSEQTQLIELPQAGAVRLMSIGAPSAGGSYSGSTAAAVVCSDNMPKNLQAVVTGVKDGDTVFIGVSSDTGGYTYLDPRLLIGQNVDILAAAAVSLPPNGTGTVKLPIDLSALAQKTGFNLQAGGKFYLQAMIFPPGTLTGTTANFQGARYSELDMISVDSCQTGPYGGGSYGGGGY